MIEVMKEQYISEFWKFRQGDWTKKLEIKEKN